MPFRVLQGYSDPLRAEVPQSGMESYVPQGDSDPLRAEARVESYALKRVELRGWNRVFA